MRSPLRRLALTGAFAGGALAFGLRLVSSDWGAEGAMRLIVSAVACLVLALWAIGGWLGGGFPHVGGAGTTALLGLAAVVIAVANVAFVVTARPSVGPAADAWLVTGAIAASVAWVTWCVASWLHVLRTRRAERLAAA